MVAPLVTLSAAKGAESDMTRATPFRFRRRVPVSSHRVTLNEVKGTMTDMAPFAALRVTKCRY